MSIVMQYIKVIFFTVCILILIYYIQLPVIEGISFKEKCMVDGLNRNNIKIDRDNKILIKDGINIKYNRNFNTKTGLKNCNDKIKTNNLLVKHNIPMPKSYIWNNSLTMKNNINSINHLKYPLVIKPNKGTQGYGVTTNIKNENQLTKVVNDLLQKTKNTMKNIIVEEHYTGDNYRVMVFNNEVMGIVKRDNPYVLGNGKSTLKNLIKNHKQSKHKIHEIDIPYIKSQNVDLDTVIPANEKIIVSKVNNYHNGAPIYNVPLTQVHPDNIEMFKKAAQALNINLTGIDYMTKNLMTPYHIDGVIIEANEFPDLTMHCDSSTSIHKNAFIDNFLNKLFNT
tara:strand:+ start:16374 stop:17387 length:1014 start_codon:yes stop_codon:yes gene_type:complete